MLRLKEIRARCVFNVRFRNIFHTITFCGCKLKRDKDNSHPSEAEVYKVTNTQSEETDNGGSSSTSLTNGAGGDDEGHITE